MAVQVITRDYGYVNFAAGQTFDVEASTGMVTIYDEDSEELGAFAQWIGVLKTD